MRLKNDELLADNIKLKYEIEILKAEIAKIKYETEKSRRYKMAKIGMWFLKRLTPMQLNDGQWYYIAREIPAKDNCIFSQMRNNNKINIAGLGAFDAVMQAMKC